MVLNSLLHYITSLNSTECNIIQGMKKKYYDYLKYKILTMSRAYPMTRVDK